MNSCLTSFLLFDKCMSETESCVLCVSVHFPFWCIHLNRHITHENLIKCLCQTCVLVWTVLLCSYWIRLATILLQPHAIPAKDNKSEKKKKRGKLQYCFFSSVYKALVWPRLLSQVIYKTAPVTRYLMCFYLACTWSCGKFCTHFLRYLSNTLELFVNRVKLSAERSQVIIPTICHHRMLSESQKYP